MAIQLLSYLLNRYRDGQGRGAIKPADHRDLAQTAQYWGSPVVADAAARDALYPTPGGDEKTLRKDINNVERYDAVTGLRIGLLEPVLAAYDDFERPDQIGLGTTKTGQVWALTGAGVANLQIQSGRYTMGAASLGAPQTGYASIQLGTAPIRYGAKFSFALGPGGTVNPLAIISSSDATFLIQNMFHLIISPVSYTPTVWVAGVSHPMATTSAQTSNFATPLLTDGTVYECWITVNPATNTAHIDLPDGTSVDVSDPSLGASFGSLLTYEHTYGNTSTAVSRFESIAAYTPNSRTLAGPVSVPTGLQNTPLGSVGMAAGFFSQVGVNTQTPLAQMHIESTSTAGTPPDTLLIRSLVNKVIARLKASAAGQTISLIFDSGQANPPMIQLDGNAQNIDIYVGGTSRLNFPLSGGSPTMFGNNFVGFMNANALTAHAGGGQASALSLTKQINRVTTVATAGDSVKLTAAKAGIFQVVINAAAVNAMDVFPATGEVINALAANAQISLAANKVTVFFCAVDGIWNSLLTA